MQGKFSQKRGTAQKAPAEKDANVHNFRKPLIIGTCCLCAAFAVGIGAMALRGVSLAPADPQPVTEAVETTPTEAPGKPSVVTADGKPDSIACQADYATSLADAADTTVAAVGDRKLTNRQLSLLYQMEIAAFRASEQAESPDFSQSLDVQKCPLSEGLSWQHYFLQQTLTHWGTQAALNMGSTEPQIITEELYEPNQERHEKYFADDYPAKAVYYGDKECFTPNSIHQAFLDNIPQMLNALAEEKGYANADDLAAAMASGAGAADLAACAESLNQAYMYYTELSYGIASDEELTAGGETLVDMRHILLIPENAKLADDLTVTASEEDWDACYTAAEDIITSIRRNWRVNREGYDAVFAEKANQNSLDAGSRLCGGRYANVRKGQLIEELDKWCFDEARQPDDMEIIRTRLGLHIVFFTGSHTSDEDAARQQSVQSAMAEKAAEYGKAYPLSVDYSLISLASGKDAVTAGDLLYPDVAHQQYPSIPLYLQQDYPNAKFGFRNVAKGGCGITTLAMISSYLADKTLTPADMGTRFGAYCTASGTDGQVFTNTPPAMGYFLEKQSWNWDEIETALRNGKIVVTLQYPGYFTSAGHFMAMEAVTEDGNIVMRDSNIFNYPKLPGHMEDCFEPYRITAASQVYWIYEPKITRIPACVRCGDMADSDVPGQLLLSEYTCEKCRTAMTRRDGFLQLMEQ